MKIVAEPLYKTNQLLVRLLGSDVQVGLYKLDASPAVPEVKSFDVLSAMIRQEETRLYFTGFAKFPDYVKVTLPDLTEQIIPLVEVVLPKDQDFTIPQAEETITPPAKAIFQEPDVKTIETVAPPEVPKLWLELALERTTPLTLGNRVTAPDLSYQGGIGGRALTNAVAQPSANTAPYLVGVPPRLEGAWSNNLPNADLSVKEKKSFLLDQIPLGWNIGLANPEDMLRLQVVSANPLPSLGIVWRPQEADRSAINVQQRMQIITPAVTTGRSLQVIVSPGAKNDRGGYLRLISNSGMYSSTDLYLEPGIPRGVRLAVEDDPGPVRIIWFQRAFQRENQALTLVAPLATTYDSYHTWGPIGSSGADIIELTPIVYEDRRWPFHQGYIRVDSDVEYRGEPISWSLLSTLGQTILKVEEGYLSSSFASTAVNITEYLPIEKSESGNYKIKWSSEGVRLISREQPGGVSVPFTFDLPIPGSVKEAPLTLRIKSFSTNRGSGVLRYFGFFPK